MVAVDFCFKNGYKIYPVTEDNNYYKVCVEINKKQHIFKNVYYKTKIDKAIEDTYFKIYKQKAT